MIANSHRQRWLTCWSVSLLLHAALVLLALAWLVHPPSFHVTAGKTSLEMELVIEPAYVAPKPPPIPVPATAIITPPHPALINIRAPLPVKPAVVTKPKPAEPHAAPKPSPIKETSLASKGAIEAQPDDLHNDPPEYPEESRMAHEQGVVILQVEVSAAGNPTAVSILKSSGFFRLDQAARHAVLHWKFHSGMSAGIPAPSVADVPVHFRLQ